MSNDEEISQTVSGLEEKPPGRVSLVHDRHEYILRIYTEHQVFLRRFLRRLLASSDDVSDIMQEVYYRLSRHKNFENIRENPKAYLFRIATNLVTDLVRKKYTHKQKMHFSYEEAELGCPRPSPEEAVSKAQQLKVLKQACDKLSPQERQVFFLHRLNKMTYQEISGEMGISVRTVRRWVVQVLSFLQNEMKRHG
ncbi:MAG: hypothetical protein COB49_12505 [Alphaproteobacteria bacterium]|nr:MAG: hypothetical protein COB49_12505 [Alphaproteobacteria bacterium]